MNSKFIKKIITFVLVLCTMFSIFKIGNVSASEPTFLLTDVMIDEKSENTEAEVVNYDNESFKVDETFHKVNDYIIYKLTIKNTSNNNYKLKLINDNLGSSNLEYTYDYTEGDVISANSTIEIPVKVTYKKGITDLSKRDQSGEIKIQLFVEDEDGNIVDEDVLVNPKTGDNIGTYVTTLIISLICFGLINLRNKKVKTLLIVAMLTTPMIVKALDASFVITVTNNAKLYDKMVVTYNINGVKTKKTVSYNGKLEMPEEPNVEGYIFDGWYVNDEEYNFDDKVTEDIELVAKMDRAGLIYWALSDKNAEDHYETLTISSYEVDGDLKGSFYSNSRFTFSQIPWIASSNASSSLSSYVTVVNIEGTVRLISTDYWFSGVGYNSSSLIMNLENLDTSKVTNMSSMFSSAGYNATTWNIGGLSNWDTSSVTDMRYMFSGAGYNAAAFNLDLSNWDTSSVTDMSYMFNCTGYKTTTFNIIGLSNWDTSSVTDMRYMFSKAGYNSTTWNIGNLSNWDTSKVTNMSYMFLESAFYATTFNLDLSNWDASEVTNMEWMFAWSGYRSTIFNLNLSNWDASKVTNMSYMFNVAGFDATTFNLDLSNWDTSSVTNMSYMFYCAGNNATTWNIRGLLNWDTSNVTNMKQMFLDAGYYATSFNLDLSNWNTSKVIEMNAIFVGAIM